MISLIIPAWNGARYIAEAIESAKANQFDEIMVVDDASPDESGEIAKNLGCKVIKHSINRHQIEARNTGLRNILGEYVMFLDQDDVLVSGALTVLYAELMKNPFPDVIQAKADDFITGKPGNVKLRKGYYGQISGAMLFKKSVFDRIGFFSVPANSYTGEMMWLRDQFAKFGITVRKMDFVSVKRRIHAENFGILHRDLEYRDYAAILRARLKSNNKKNA